MDDSSEDLDTKTLAMLLLGQLSERTRAHPVSTLAGAATFGYMLGWTMPGALYRTVGSYALRAVAMNVLSRLFHPQGDEDLDGEQSETSRVVTGSSRPANRRSADPYVA